MQRTVPFLLYASRFRLYTFALLSCALGVTSFACRNESSAQISTGGPVDGWAYYGHDAGGSHYSPLTQIDKNNVKELKVAWTYHTGDVSDGKRYHRKSEFEATPILADGTLYLSTAFNRIIALDPETGKERWSYDPRIDLQGNYSEGLMNRGVSTWLDPARKQGEPCRRRIFLGTIDARLIGVDGANGRPCDDFGNKGQVDLTQGISNIIRKGEYEETSPPAVIDDLVVVGSAIADNDRVEMPGGVVRAFDAHSGALRWSWDPIPRHAADPARNTWENGAERTGAGNAWSISSVTWCLFLRAAPVQTTMAASGAATTGGRIR